MNKINTPRKSPSVYSNNRKPNFYAGVGIYTSQNSLNPSSTKILWLLGPEAENKINQHNTPRKSSKVLSPNVSVTSLLTKVHGSPNATSPSSHTLHSVENFFITLCCSLEISMKHVKLFL